MPTADQDRSPSPLARSLHGKSFRHPGKRHAVACGVTPECKSEPKHEGSSEDEMRYGIYILYANVLCLTCF